MLKSNRVVISVPGNELRNVDLPGSVFEAEKLDRMPISEGLKRAYHLVSALRKDPICVIRPEIFAHGRARNWMDTRLGAVREHICLSDGTAVKVIGGLQNHVFFYGLGQRKSSGGLQNLLTWAPEIFCQLQSQINTFYGAMINGRLVQPPTVISLPKSGIPGAPAELYEFLLRPECPEEGARCIIEKGAIPNPVVSAFKELIYIPLSETGTYDATFSRLVSQTIATAYFNTDQCVLLRLPTLSDESADLTRRIIATLEAIRASGIVMPRVPALNVFLVRSDLAESFFDAHDRVSLIVDDTFEFWSYSHAFLKNLYSVRYLVGGDRRELQGMVRGLTSILGRAPSGRHSSSATPPILLNWNQGDITTAHKR
jgi:hypothetical protein